MREGLGTKLLVKVVRTPKEAPALDARPSVKVNPPPCCDGQGCGESPDHSPESPGEAKCYVK
jgi:hypothetical protein